VSERKVEWRCRKSRVEVAMKKRKEVRLFDTSMKDFPPPGSQEKRRNEDFCQTQKKGEESVT